MANTITLKIDVTLVDKARLFTGRPRADGHSPKYLDIILVPRREPGKFGDTHLVKQSLSKEEREAGVEMPIIGSATERSPRPPSAAAAAPRHSAPTPKLADDDHVLF